MDNLKRLIDAARVYRPIPKLKMEWNGGVITLKPYQKSKGRALVSYTTLPFVGRDTVLGGHTNQWECKEIVNIFLERSYTVDVIDSTNITFIPHLKYDYFLDVHTNFDRITPHLPSHCTKILHATTSYWPFQNEAELKRIAAVEKRRGAKLMARRILPASRAFDHADAISLLGNAVTKRTYPTSKPITLIPLSTTHVFSSPVTKHFDEARTHFIWLGGSGMVHKGLDLVLEAFSQMPQFTLSICGKVGNEKDFEKAYRRELYETPNIKVLGLVDPGSDQFDNLRSRSVALIYPSCAEGQAGSVVLSMHAGLIPIVSTYSGVDVGESGITLLENSVEEIKHAVSKIAESTVKELERMSISAWNYAREHHTKETFGKAYRAFIGTLDQKKQYEN